MDLKELLSEEKREWLLECQLFIYDRKKMEEKVEDSTVQFTILGATEYEGKGVSFTLGKKWVYRNTGKDFAWIPEKTSESTRGFLISGFIGNERPQFNTENGFAMIIPKGNPLYIND